MTFRYSINAVLVFMMVFGSQISWAKPDDTLAPVPVSVPAGTPGTAPAPTPAPNSTDVPQIVQNLTLDLMTRGRMQSRINNIVDQAFRDSAAGKVDVAVGKFNAVEEGLAQENFDQVQLESLKDTLEQLKDRSKKSELLTVSDSINLQNDFMRDLSNARLWRDASSSYLDCGPFSGSSFGCNDFGSTPLTLFHFLAQIPGFRDEDYKAEANTYRLRYDSLSIDLIADRVISQYAMYAVASALPPFITNMTVGIFAQALNIGAPAALNLLINTSLVNVLAELYGEQLSTAKQLAILTALAGEGGLVTYAAGMASHKIGTSNSGKPTLPSVPGGVLTQINQILRASNAGFRTFRTSLTGTEIIPFPQGTDIPQVQKTPQLIPPATPTPPTDTPPAQPTDPSPGSDGKPKLQRAYGTLALVLGAVVSGAAAYSLTYATGHILKSAFRKALIDARLQQNRAFAVRLHDDVIGDAILKLLIGGMYNSSKPPQKNLDLSETSAASNPAMRVILSVARASGVCTKEDLKVVNEFVHKHSELAGNVQALINAAGPKELGLDGRAKIGACWLNRVTGDRIEALNKELKTLSVVPDSYLAKLRILDRPMRLRVAELLLQLQSVDGYRDADEEKYFQLVASRFLGFDSALTGSADQRYFTIYLSHFNAEGGWYACGIALSGYCPRSMPEPVIYMAEQGVTPADAPFAENLSSKLPANTLNLPNNGYGAGNGIYQSSPLTPNGIGNPIIPPLSPLPNSGFGSPRSGNIPTLPNNTIPWLFP